MLYCFADVLVQDVGVHADCAPVVLLLSVSFCFLGVTSGSVAGLTSLSERINCAPIPFIS